MSSSRDCVWLAGEADALSFAYSGSDVVRDPTLSTLLSSGVIRPPPDDIHDLPKSAG